MKIVMKIGCPCRFFRVELMQPASMVKVRALVGKGKYSQAMVTALSCTGPIEELSDHSVPGLEADLILSEQSAHWGLGCLKK